MIITIAYQSIVRFERIVSGRFSPLSPLTDPLPRPPAQLRSRSSGFRARSAPFSAPAPLTCSGCQLTLKIAEEIDFENRRISNFKGLVTLTLTLDRVIRHTVVHHSIHSSTSTYIPNFIGIGRTIYARTDGRTDIWPMLLRRLFGVDLKTKCLPLPVQKLRRGSRNLKSRLRYSGHAPLGVHLISAV